MVELTNNQRAKRLKELIEKALALPENPDSINGLASKMGVNNATVRGWLLLTNRVPDVGKLDYDNAKAIANCLGWSLDEVDEYLEEGKRSPKDKP